MKYKICLLSLACVLCFLSIFFSQGAIRNLKFQKWYASGAYVEAQNIGEKDILFSPQELHNLWNTLYRQFEADTTQISKWERALSYYSGSLLKQEHPDTRYNYEFMKKILATLEKNSQEQKDKENESQKDTASSGTGSTGTWSQEWKTGTGTDSSQEAQETPSGVSKNARDEQYKMGQNEEIDALTPEEKQILEASLESLEEEQTQNQVFYWKQEGESSDFQKAFENLMWGSQEKDW